MSLSAVLDESALRVSVTITGLPVLPTPPEDPWPAGPWTLFRTDGQSESPVRGAIARPLTEFSSTIVRDYEQPLNRPYAYLLRYVDATTGPVVVYSNWITPPSRELPRISNPVTGEGVDVTIVTWPEFVTDASSSAVDVAGRESPFVVVGEMTAPVSQMTLRTLDAGGWRLLNRLLRTGQVFQVRASVLGVDDGYVVPSRVALQRITNRAADVRRRFVVDVTETSMPTPEVAVAAANLQAIADLYPGGTLADIAADFDTLLDVFEAVS